MMEDQVEKLVQLRLRQAKESLAEAKALFDVDLWRGTINRSYYAMFYAVLALAVQRQVITSKHSGLITFFDREFVKTGIFPKELSKAIHLAFQRRQEHDYGDVFAVSQGEAEQAYGEARSFVDAVAQYFEAES